LEPAQIPLAKNALQREDHAEHDKRAQHKGHDGVGSFTFHNEHRESTGLAADVQCIFCAKN
jgi:hypothetical protein